MQLLVFVIKYTSVCKILHSFDEESGCSKQYATLLHMIHQKTALNRNEKFIADRSGQQVKGFGLNITQVQMTLGRRGPLIWLAEPTSGNAA